MNPASALSAATTGPPDARITTELIVGGQKSGKSRRAEQLACDWLAISGAHRALLIATAEPGDDEMRARIARHQRERAERVPGLGTVQEPHDLAAALLRHGGAQTLLVVDCLTLWLSHWSMPIGLDAMDSPQRQALALDWEKQRVLFLEAIRKAPGPVVLVGNEIGLGVIPLGRAVRAFVDALGTLNQQLAQICPRVTLMVAGLPLTLKDPCR
ncbi:bifunctional adenosylcobinamide kinase/adenosylcobinamide-phosphate guanylyltransferase [Verminephrobacter aporrectodeae]|uniref:bifunctional adenosylcobinamide kinase/adenosylcobinamide-phosphate guanylyltransferase n=1 Tax=Verminephrobacter aporrectodeae TaxID=1110389 RepID=UPI0022447D35|nr:bifunctional adenosylcobinamide kinase/adenosylcobinamide-phosphate guanylyltransferase [Verminephrobacter aporrectodeae]MCW8174267.1 bifunctional adenosylcobinamide kinase/adenosylcobinamide-phosphate guanylyltransferase [Verminephrobacter aporrectodeae subsp. tuberculatae]MCW8201966.1 bifunctional adenosylcobinamide kinase/adenosylcobinamide-phosphate guanylyltransferase [Verminephrobacter aporrectodeae subsp. tuberculatae]